MKWKRVTAAWMIDWMNDWGKNTKQIAWCGQNNQTIQHMLQECPALAHFQFKTWPPDTPISQKLLGGNRWSRIDIAFLKLFGMENMTEECVHVEREESKWLMMMTMETPVQFL
jgi:hypothetical protein